LRIRVLDREPDLAESLSEAEFAAARPCVVAPLIAYRRGPWRPAESSFDGDGCLGLLVIEGLLVRRVTVGQRTCAELLGPGDLLAPWLRVGPGASIATEVSWEVEQAARLAVLDREFVRTAARWPPLMAAAARRAVLRAHWLAFHLAVCHMRRVDDRVLLVLWHFADRWGRMTPRGAELDLPLTHSLLAAVVGAYRPSVTVALRALSQAGRIERRARSHWLLPGSPPAELAALHAHAGGHDQPLPEEIGGAERPGHSAAFIPHRGSARSRRG
jgi:CRP/FNR family cyclic AMP-dependent transcriptional regulator